MSEHKSPYTGEQVDKMLDTTNYTLFPALVGIGPNLDEQGNENLSNPTNNPPEERYGGTFNEFKDELMKLLDRSFMKDFFIKNEDNSVTINVVKLFKEFDIRKNTPEGETVENTEIYASGTIPDNNEPDIINRLIKLSAESIILGFSQNFNGQVRLTPTTIDLFTHDGKKYLIRQYKSGTKYVFKIYEPNSGNEILSIDTDGVVNFKQPEGKEVMFCDFSGRKLFGISDTGFFELYSLYGGTLLKVGFDGLYMPDISEFVEGDYNFIAGISSGGVVGKIAISWFAKSEDLQTLSGIIDYQRSNLIAVYGGNMKEYHVEFINSLPSENYIIQFTSKGMNATFNITDQTANGFTVEITPNADATFGQIITSIFNQLQRNKIVGFYTDDLTSIDLPLSLHNGADFLNLFTVNPDGTLTAKVDIIGVLNITSFDVNGNVYPHGGSLYDWGGSALFTILGNEIHENNGSTNINFWSVNIPTCVFDLNIPAGTVVPKNHVVITTTKNLYGSTEDCDYQIDAIVNATISLLSADYAVYFTTNKISM